jgi:hypothetical protein
LWWLWRDLTPSPSGTPLHFQVASSNWSRFDRFSVTLTIKRQLCFAEFFETWKTVNWSVREKIKQTQNSSEICTHDTRNSNYQFLKMDSGAKSTASGNVPYPFCTVVLWILILMDTQCLLVGWVRRYPGGQKWPIDNRKC